MYPEKLQDARLSAIIGSSPPRWLSMDEGSGFLVGIPGPFLFGGAVRRICPSASGTDGETLRGAGGVREARPFYVCCIRLGVRNRRKAKGERKRSNEPQGSGAFGSGAYARGDDSFF